ncbi:MAG: AMP-binding protein [gamma proteobacterium symbiont of Taylorina sp.]|nr:AMP-binding protein [gamma proteobacterium symbiont of Taylorina sp.]
MIPTTVTKPADLINHLELYQPDDIVLAIATSGSQAEPKIALISHKNIIAHCRSFVRSIPVNSRSMWLNCMPMSHIAGVMIVYRCWFYHTAMLLHDSFNVERVWRDLHLHPITHISLVPRMLFLLLEHQLMIQKNNIADSTLPKSLSYVIVGGDKISDTLYQRAVLAGWPVYFSYGMTEAASTIAIGRNPERLKLLEGFSAIINAQGTLNIKGDMVISSYANPADNYRFDENGFKTNDRVQIEGDYLQFLGRNDYMIISGGESIAPEYIESLLSEAPGIKGLAIAKYRDDNPDNINADERGDTIVALVHGDIEQLKSWSQLHIKSCYRPRIFIKVEKIPINILYKIDRQAIEEILYKKLPC